MTARRSRLRSERGSTLVTFLLLFPLFLAFLELIVIGGRVATTRADVTSAAREAARQASVAAGPGSAPSVIGEAASVALAGKGFSCLSPGTVLGPGTNFVAGGQVEVVVVCRVSFADISLLPVPGSMIVTGTGVEPIDRFRVVD